MRPRPYVVVGVCGASPPGAVTSIGPTFEIARESRDARGRDRHDARQLGRRDAGVVADVSNDRSVRWPVGADVVGDRMAQVLRLVPGRCHDDEAALLCITGGALEILEYRPLTCVVRAVVQVGVGEQAQVHDAQVQVARGAKRSRDGV